MMNAARPVTLQISLAPTDLPHATYIVPHQLRQLASQVDEVLFVVDLHRSHGRFAEGWEARLPGLRSMLDDLCAIYPHARSTDVDYSPETKAAVEETFFDGQTVPLKDYRGGPFYAYFFALLAASHDLVFHVDSDMMFGGGSTTWIREALELLQLRPDVLACNPLPGPPTNDGSLRSQVLEPEGMPFPAFRSRHLSSRLFVLDRRRLTSLELARPNSRKAWGARVDGNPPFLAPEAIISRLMEQSGLFRLDFLGTGTGMWALHPPYRSRLFYARLPSLVSEVEHGEMCEAQRGRHDVEDCTVDWSDVRPSAVRSLRTHSKLLFDRVLSLWRGVEDQCTDGTLHSTVQSREA